jgi:AMMECR1 domain-containing protein
MRAAIEGSGGVEETEASKNTILTQAIGSVAIESACLDQVFREVLSDLTNAEFEVGLLFEGQSTEWLTSTCNIILNEVGHEYN